MARGKHHWIVCALWLQELRKILDKKEVRLSKEPPLSDEVITIVVRMPVDKLEVKLALEYDEILTA